jgi:glycosyltransferase involved in cell wall biosynthesis
MGRLDSYSALPSTIRAKKTPEATILYLPFINLERFPHLKLFDYILYNIEVTLALVLMRIAFRQKFLIEFANWEIDGGIFMMVNIFLKLPVIVRLHSGVLDLAEHNDKITLSDRIIFLFERFSISRKETTLICSTRAHALREMNKYRNSKEVEIIPLGVELPKIHTHTFSQELHILFYGRIERRKGIIEFIQAAKYILGHIPDVHFDIVGRDYSHMIPALLKTLPKKSKSKIHVFGYLSNAELETHIRRADICVFLPYYESFGLTIAEAMSYRKAVIATHVGGIVEIISSGVNGLLIEPKNPDACVHALLQLIHDTRLRKKLGANARKKIEKDLSIPLMAKRSNAFYTRILSSV